MNEKKNICDKDGKVVFMFIYKKQYGKEGGENI